MDRSGVFAADSFKSDRLLAVPVLRRGVRPHIASRYGRQIVDRFTVGRFIVGMSIVGMSIVGMSIVGMSIVDRSIVGMSIVDRSISGMSISGMAGGMRPKVKPLAIF